MRSVSSKSSSTIAVQGQTEVDRSSHVYLGIDFGTSGARAVVIDGDRTPQAEVSLPVAAVDPNQRPRAWQTTLFDLIDQIPQSLRSRISRIAIDGTSSTVLLCDGEGTPLHAPLMYNDACDQAPSIFGDRTLVEGLRAIAPPGHPVVSASSSLVKLLWLQTQVKPQPAHYLLHQADWFAALLHGQLGLSDYHNSLKLGYDPALERYPDWFQHPALEGIRSLLPRVVGPGTVIGAVRPAIAHQLNLPNHCQICAGTTDSIAAFLASGANQPGAAVTSLGSTLVLKLLSRTRIDNAAYGIYSHRLGDKWLVGGASNTGGAVLQHYFTPLELANLSTQIDPSQTSPLDYYPLLKPGERFPLNDPQLPPRLTPRPSDPIAFLHGLLESLARIEAQGYALLQAQGATPLVQVFTAGGGGPKFHLATHSPQTPKSALTRTVAPSGSLWHSPVSSRRTEVSIFHPAGLRFLCEKLRATLSALNLGL